jgi:flagellar protein FlbB
LPEPEAIVLLERLDTKTVAKLAPFVNQPRLVRWIDENLNIRP